MGSGLRSWCPPLCAQFRQVDLHQAGDGEDVHTHGALEAFLGNAFVGAVHGAHPIGIDVVRIFRSEARRAGEFARIRAAADGERLAVKAGSFTVGRGERLNGGAVGLGEEGRKATGELHGCTGFRGQRLELCQQLLARRGGRW